ncbi:hypothetical protein, variant 1 [Aphanomyces invadans]|uniref:Uncharacterized protein n=1 Tax=Aphanomyces invadans TaxID=157072 RepID=A0A024TBN4_9STRA|nr:hypothetical protein, variant 1 [Aphanomyces invadans]ETV91433.1 hypothetical protein, variant 1 [Aphanomyces invadans]|eukprot:XP_008879885.1 hypothetical protein, variant 1 [Aphanomyces invadans]
MCTSVCALAILLVQLTLFARFLVDDNMYYRSMRKRFHQLAREFRAGFGQVFVTTSNEICWQRNQTRPVPVPESVFGRMASLLEVPDASSNAWESHTLQVALETELQRDDAVVRTMEFVWRIAQHPESSLHDANALEKEASRESNRRSVVHCLDGRLRRLVGTILRDETSKSAMAKCLNTAKDTVLDQCRQTAPCDVADVEATVDEFVAAFLHLVEASR